MGKVRTNILVEVSEEVNDLVVTPHKRAKTFTKLIASLLQGYLEDDYIRAYADGTLDNMRNVSVSVLDNALDSMTSSLSSMGIYGSELKNNTEQGIKHFQQYSENVENTGLSAQSSSEEIEELKGSMKSLQEQNERIFEMLKELSIGGSVSTKIVEETVVDAVSTDNSIETIGVKHDTEVKKTFEEPIKEDEEILSGYIDEEDNEEIEEEADNVDVSSILGNLISGNQYSF